MAKRLGNKKNKQKVKVKTLFLPIIASCFLFAVMIILSWGNNLSYLMGNSSTLNLICQDSYNLSDNYCEKEINSVKKGDINGDGDINNDDILLINEHLSSNVILTNLKFKAADINNDGKITIEDVNLIKQHISTQNVINGSVCPDNYILNENKCYISEKAVTQDNNNYKIGDAILYHNSYWYILDDSEDYLTLLKQNSLTDIEINSSTNLVYYNSNLNNILDNYVDSFKDDLKDVDGYKVRLITIDELNKLGFSDKTNTKYYEKEFIAPYWLEAGNNDYWVMKTESNSSNKAYVVNDYEYNTYIFENDVNNTLATIRPVINLYKSKL